MNIHNIYSDLLLSTTYFLNNKVLRYSSTNIKGFEYNIGNASFQLKYDTQYDLPAAIVRMESPRKWLGISHPYSYQFNTFGNIHRTTILHNQTKDLDIELQEEMYEIPISITINCESQIQALDIQHTFQQYTPLGAYLNYYEFVSFLELESSIFNKWMFDLQKDKIINLFYKQNEYTDVADYCFALKFAPLMRINDVSISLGQSNDPSYSVNISLEAVTSIPSYIIYPFFDISSNVEIPTVRVERLNRWIPTKEVPTVKVCPKRINGDALDPVYVQVTMVDEMHSGFEQSFMFEDEGSEKTGILKGRILVEKKLLDVQSLVKGTSIIGTATIDRNLETDILTGTISGDNITGRLRKIEYLDATTLRVFFEGMLAGIITEDTITFEYSLLNTIHDVINMAVSYPDNPQYTVGCLDNVKSKCLYSVVSDMNPYTSLVNLNDTIIKGYMKDGIFTEFDPPLEFDANGGFSIDNTYGSLNPSTGCLELSENIGTAVRAFGQHFVDPSHDTGEITIDGIQGNYNINTGDIVIGDKTGHVDLTTGALIFDDDYGDVDWETGVITANRLDSLLTDLVFDHSKIGGQYIQKIITHFTHVNQPITSSLDTIQGYDYNFIMSNIESTHIKDEKRYEFQVPINSTIEYIDISGWKITVPEENFIADSTMNTVELISATDHVFVFRCPEALFLKNIDSVNVVNPLILSFTTIT